MLLVASVTYINTDSDNRTSLGANNEFNPMVRLLTIGQNESLEEMKNYWIPFKEGIEEARPATGTNPYFLVHENTNGSEKKSCIRTRSLDLYIYFLA